MSNPIQPEGMASASTICTQYRHHRWVKISPGSYLRLSSSRTFSRDDSIRWQKELHTFVACLVLKRRFKINIIKPHSVFLPFAQYLWWGLLCLPLPGSYRFRIPAGGFSIFRYYAMPGTYSGFVEREHHSTSNEKLIHLVQQSFDHRNLCRYLKIRRPFFNKEHIRRCFSKVPLLPRWWLQMV